MGTTETLLPVKTRNIDVRSLLGNSHLAERFNRGTAISCVLMPNNYHRFHAPVTGSLVEGRLVEGFYFGISDGETWFNKGNTGASDMEFSTFEDFQRPLPVTKGDQAGYFQYGGSLNILIFESGVFSSVAILMGQRLGRMHEPAVLA